MYFYNLCKLHVYVLGSLKYHEEDRLSKLSRFAPDN